jgi:hypothetical protein
VLTNPTVVAIVPHNHSYLTELTAFANAMPASQWWSAISAEYGLGTLSVITYQGGALSGSIDQNGLTSYVEAIVAQDAAPPPNGRTVYLVFVPSAAAVKDRPCATYGGDHDTFPTAGGSGAGDALALVITCTDDPQDPSQLDYLTKIASHEVLESITDPLWSAQRAWIEKSPMPPTSGSPFWQVPSELADLCTPAAEVEQGFVFQRIWSVQAAAHGGDPCIPPSSTGYYGVTQSPGTPDWVGVAPGQTVQIPLTGWSTGPPAPGWWLLNSWLPALSPGLQGATSTIASPRVGAFGSCGTGPIADNAGAAGNPTLSVSVPAGAASGDWGVVEIDSFRQDDTKQCAATHGTDLRRFWIVGVYVP